jgi:phosphoribosylformimino-5-aminoimidazole carboxamide ribotide isomerase
MKAAAQPAMAEVLPVIDLMAGQVVRGQGGQRTAYRPIVSPLCAGSEPLAVAQALCQRTGSHGLYVADLDAIMGGTAQTAVLARLLAGLPGLRELWLDAGLPDAAAARRLLGTLAAQAPGAARVVPVFGSESLASRAAWLEAKAAWPQAVLSLDRRGETLLDPADCWAAPALWPQRVIVMTLERVGSAAGPDLQTVAAVCARHGAHPGGQVWGAGGLRSEADLRAAARAGAAGWLVASALHDGRLHAPAFPA